MATVGIRTAADLSAFVGRWVVLTTPDQINLNTAPGTASQGVLVHVYEFAGVQWGQVDSGVDAHKLVTGGVFATGDKLTNDATGRSVLAVGPDVILAVALEGSLKPDELRKAFAFSGGLATGGGGPALPAGEVAFGTGVGITSSPDFQHSGGAVEIVGIPLEVTDSTPDILFDTDPNPLTRSVRFPTPLGHIALFIDATEATASITCGDLNSSRFHLDSIKRVAQTFDATGAIQTWSVDWQTGAPLTYATLAAAGAGLGNGQSAYIDNVLKPGDIPGAGSGVLCTWYFRPVPGWYTPLLVLATI